MPSVSRTHALVAAVAPSLAAALAYGALLALGKLVPRYDCLVFMGVLLGIFRLLRDAPRRARTIALYGVTQIFVMAYVVHLWSLGYEGRNAVFGGIIPWSDSFDYLDDAYRLVHGNRFTEFSSKRPIFGVVLAFFLKASWGSLRLPLLVCSVMGAFAVALAALEVWKTHGHRSAFVVFLVLLFFERRWAGFLQTEHVGLPLGAIAFALFWRAQDCRDADPARAKRLVLMGMFSLSTGLMARAGAFFVIPALAIWSAKYLETERWARLRFLGLATAAALFGFALHKTVLFATGSGVTFSDYPGIAYGLIHGEDYTYLTQTHPALLAMGVGERVPASWSIVMADAAAHPALVVSGFAQSFAGLFASPHGMFGYLFTNPDDSVLEGSAAKAVPGLFGPLILWRRTLGTYSLLNAGAMGLLSASFVLSTMYSLFVLFWKRRTEEGLSLVRYAAAGVLLSAPFTPPWITSGMQVQTVTLAFVAAIPAVVVLARPGDGPAVLVLPDRIFWVPVGFAAFLFFAVAWLRLSPLSAPYCDATTHHRVEVYAGTRVEVVSARSLSLDDRAEGDLRASLRFLSRHNEELTNSIEPVLHPGTVYVLAFDACDRRAKLLVDDHRVLDMAPGFRTIDADALASPKILRVHAPPPVEP